MELQERAIERIDRETTEILEEIIRRDEPAPLVISIVFQMVVAPIWLFIKEYFFRGRIIKGLEGIKTSVNLSVSRFTLEAKRYELYFKDDKKLLEKRKEFVNK